MKKKMTRGRKTRKCRLCNKSCYGSYCRECFVKKKHGHVGRWASRKRKEYAFDERGLLVELDAKRG